MKARVNPQGQEPSMCDSDLPGAKRTNAPNGRWAGKEDRTVIGDRTKGGFGQLT